MEDDLRKMIENVKFDVYKCNEIIANICVMIEINMCSEVETEYIFSVLKKVLDESYKNNKGC